ncbi:MAG TPA: hypothetical protein VMO47_09920, partial [Rhodothermales bacterium]|nr:hypothetical protein [Rhodothermales bacterium]
MSTSFCDWRRALLPLLWIGVTAASAFAQVPRTIAFQGLMTDDQGVVLSSGEYGITFRLYSQATEGSALWSEVQSVSVIDGVANATLGGINPLTLSFDVPYWLGITLQQGGTELAPRIPLTAGAYALMAADVPDGLITADKLANGSVTTAKIQEEGLGGGAIADGAITPGKLADGAITAVKMADNSVGAGAIIDGSITAEDLANGAVGAAAIAAGAVTPAKVSTTGATNGQTLVFNGTTLAWGAPSGSGVISEVKGGAGLTGGGTGGIVTLNVGSEALTADFIAPNAIGNSELANNAVDTENIVNQAVTTQKLDPGAAQAGFVLSFNGANVNWAAPSVADGSITAAKLAANAVTTEKIGADAVTTDKIGAAAVTTTKIGARAVTTQKLDPGAALAGFVLSFDGTNVNWVAPSVADGAITAAKLAASAVTTEKIAANAVTTDKIGGGAVTTAKIGAGAVTSTEIGPGAVTAEKIGTGAVETGKIDNLAVTSGKLDNASVTTVKIADGNVTLPKLNASAATADEVIRYTGTTVEWGPVSIPDGSIDTDQLANLAVTSAKLNNAAVNSDKIASSAVNSIHVGLGQITNSHIGGLLALDKLSTVGADEGDVITFAGGVVTWEPGSALSQTGNVQIDGDLAVSGSVEKGGGTFRIDHPLDPENQYLYHSFVESDEMMNVYSGNVTLEEDGTAWVELPEWFEALNKDFRYQLTCVGGYAPVYVSESISSRRFQVAGGHEGLQVSWQVTAVRNDPWARKNRMRVEVVKPAEERGSLIHPEAYDR